MEEDNVILADLALTLQQKEHTLIGVCDKVRNGVRSGEESIESRISGADWFVLYGT